MELAVLIFLSIKYSEKALPTKYIKNRFDNKLVYKSRISKMPQQEVGAEKTEENIRLMDT